MEDPVTEFKTKVVQTPKGATVVYHVGHLALDISSSPTLTNIQMFAYGLYLMGRIGLRQRRVSHINPAVVGGSISQYEYSLVVLAPVHATDFDTARKTYLDNHIEQ